MCSRRVAVSPLAAAAKVVGAVSYRLLRVQQFDHMFGNRTHYRLGFEQVIEYEPTGGNAHDAHRNDFAERADPLPAGPGASGRPPWPARNPRSTAVEAGRRTPALPGHRSADVDGATSATSDYPRDHGGAGPARGADHHVAGAGRALRWHAAGRHRAGGGPDARPARAG